ncbi:MAG TPA: isocitrate lyase/phosphoenolpyruvate mutase family protein [Thermoanaerobaculia bacterium]|nr:isocitrate lyase/phosphoenolpyruvate mutase family protein [Thermoanaerobaculia bacterium]
MNISLAQKALAEQFLALHRMQRPFVLANCWDVVTAALFAREGFQAIGTSSYATAAALGLPDGQHIALQDTVDLVKRLVRRVKLPVSADIESGYAETVEGVVQSAKAVLAAGAVGLNIEDSTGNPEQPFFNATFQCRKIAAIRAMADEMAFHPVINARTDTFLLSKDNGSGRLRQTIERGRAYVQAGADCVFVPDMGDLDVATMRQLIDEIGAPINIVAGGTTPPMSKLEEIGIVRVSLGPRVMRAGLGLFRDIAREILDRGTFTKMTTGALSYEDTNQLLAEPKG